MNHRFFTLTTTAALLATALVAGCSDEDDATDTVGTSSLTLSLEGLEPLGDGFVYEGWFIVDGAPVTTGRFDVAVDQTEYTFEVDATEAANTTAFVLTIEPAEGDDPAPSDVHVLGGDVIDGSSTLTMSHMTALGVDLASSDGSFILETPTSMAADDAFAGIWYLEMTADGPAASLNLPELPSGWAYEGWVVGEDGPVSTGVFTSIMGADSDGAGPTAGTDADAPPFPGQDFVTPLVDLRGQMAVISVEPVPDDSPAPFAIKPLVGEIADEAGGVSQSLMNNAAAGPRGTATIN
ncbi:MAG: anti-sigma factor [Myxococcota bacterium]